MDKYGIKPGSVTREALEREVRRIVLEEAEKRAKKLSGKLKEIPDEEIAKLIREDRESRWVHTFSMQALGIYYVNCINVAWYVLMSKKDFCRILSSIDGLYSLFVH